MKIVFPMLIIGFAWSGSMTSVNAFDCQDMLDIRARMSCYDVTSRGPRADMAPPSITEAQPTRRPTRRVVRAKALH